METVAALLAALGSISSMVTSLVAQHEKALAAKDKEIVDLKKIVASIKDAPK